MKSLLGILFLLCFSFNCLAQACFTINHETSYRVVLPGCQQKNGAIIVRRTVGGTDPYTYKIGNTESAIGLFTELREGVYNLVSTDARSCKDSVLIDLRITSLADIVNADNTITPNGDGINDKWRISGINNIRLAEVSIYNRWGKEIFFDNSYDSNFGWDGTVDGNDVAVGTYYYIISVSNNCLSEQISGHITVIR